MPTDASHSCLASRTAREAPPTVEVQLSSARPQPPMAAVVRHTVAWLLVGAFGLTSLLAGTKSDPRTGELIAAKLIVPLFVLTMGTLVWATLETRWSTRRRSARRSPPRFRTRQVG